MNNHQHTLFDSHLELLRSDYLRIPYWHIREVRSAAQTLSAITELMDSETRELFCSAKKVAEKACAPLNTIRRHLEYLQFRKAIENLGRQYRRTPTYRVAGHWIDPTERYGALPRWTAKMPCLGWPERAVYSYFVSYWQLGERLRADEMATIENEFIAQISIRKLANLFGMSKTTIQRAITLLSIPIGGESMLDVYAPEHRKLCQTITVNEKFLLTLINPL